MTDPTAAPPPPADLLAAALAYAGLGLRVVPLHRVVSGVGDAAACSCGRPNCGSQGKHPRPKAWQKEASADAGAVRAWWAEVPAGNVGVALGSASGVVGVDVDPPGGEAALAAAAGVDLPPTWEVATGKGRRLLYAIPDGLEFDPRTHAFADAAGLETIRVQGTGGQCVMPPSWHPAGRAYAWLPGRSPADLAPAPMPEWLIRLMEPAPAKPARARPVADAAAGGAFAPGADFNRRGDWWRDVLEPAGATPAGKRADGVEYVTRPGKRGGVSATLGHYTAQDGTPALYVFSGSWPGLAAGKCYDLFGALARLAFNGDYAAAARELGANGFGEPAARRRGPAGGAKSAGAAERPPAEPVEPVEWAPPVPLDEPADEAPAFPLHVFPPRLAEYARAVAASINCAPDFPATAMLAVAAAAVGGSARARITTTFFQPAQLYCCLVGDPSVKKTPPIKAVLRPLFAEQEARAEAMRGQSIPDQYAHGEGDMLVSDVTVEKLSDMLLRQPRGLLLFRNELAGWLSGMNQYKAKGSGADRPFFLEAYDGDPITVHRAKNPEGIHVPNPALSLLGSTQPDVVKDFFDRPDGMAQRILWAFPARIPAREEQFLDVPAALVDGWAHCLAALWQAPMREPAPGAKRPRPHTYELAADARPNWRSFTARLAAAMNDPDMPNAITAAYGKLEGAAARIALVLELVGHAAGTGRGGREITRESVDAAAEVAFYFGAHARRVARACGADERLAGARRVLDWATARGQPRFSRRDLWQGLRRNPLFRRPEDLAAPLKLLQHHNAVRWVPPEELGAGRPPAPVYEVNPAVLASPAG